MTDKELLELAAKAAGVEGSYIELDLSTGAIWSDGKWWNPLEDDGDALRLAVQLEMDLCRFGDMTRAIVESPNRTNTFIAIDDLDCKDNTYDKYAATRRAIVRAAAEIGKAMQ